MSSVYWSIPAYLLNHPSVTNRNLLARRWFKESPDSILNQYIKMDSVTAAGFYNRVFDCFPDLVLTGVGVELGAGVAAFSAVAAKRFDGIECVYALELVPDVVDLLQPITVPTLCGDRSPVVIPVIGSFDDMALPDGCLDFCIEFASLHHSENLDITLKELSRVMRPGGVILAVDRSHHDALTDGQINYMLDLKYSAEWKRVNGYDPAPLSRRTNGEHEIRLRTWTDSFFNAGFDLVARRELRTIGWKKSLRALLLMLPFPLRRAFRLLPSRVRPHAGELSWYWRCNIGLHSDPLYIKSSHDYSVFLLRKRI